jgi:hypothetical protein
MLRRFTSDEIESYFQYTKNMYQEAKLPEHLIEKLLQTARERFDGALEALEKVEKNPSIIAFIEICNKNVEYLEKRADNLKKIGFSEDEVERIFSISNKLVEHPLSHKMKMLFDTCFEKTEKNVLEEAAEEKLLLYIENTASKIDNPTTRKHLSEDQKSALDKMQTMRKYLSLAKKRDDYFEEFKKTSPHGSEKQFIEFMNNDEGRRSILQEVNALEKILESYAEGPLDKSALSFFKSKKEDNTSSVEHNVKHSM